MHKITWATFAHAHIGGLAHTHIPTYTQGPEPIFYVTAVLVLFVIIGAAHLLIKSQPSQPSRPWSPSGRPRRPYLRIVK